MINTTRAHLGDIPVDIEYEYERGERQTFDHPGYPDMVSVLAVRVGGAEAGDVESTFSESQIERWETEILEGVLEDAQFEREAAAIQRWESDQEWRFRAA